MRNKEAVKKLLGLLKDYRKIIALIIACLLISTGLNMCIPLLNRGIMDYGFIGGDNGMVGYFFNDVSLLSSFFNTRVISPIA